MMRWVSAALCVSLACAGEPVGTSDRRLIGGEPSSDAAVVQLELGAGPCSGVVISSRVVLTAAHCLGAGVSEVRVGASAPWSETAAVIAVHAHRAAVAGTSAHDVALVRLATPLTVAPLAISEDAAALATARVIGFGRRVADDPASTGVRLTATLTIDRHDDALLYSAAAGPAFTCNGDSGGPALDARGAVAAIVVAGDAACAGASQLARVDRERAWIAEVMAAWDGPCSADGACGGDCTLDPDCAPCGLDGTCTPACAAPDLDCPLGPGPGATCTDDLGCESRRCAVAPDDPTTRFCSQPCAGGCPAPITACVADRCVYPGPTPGALGAACTADDACRSGVCDRGLDACAVRCGDGDACPDGYACASTGRGALCRPDDGGCAVGAGAGPAVALALLGLRRRRRRARR